MLFQRTDKLFEKAVVDPAQCERLLKHYRGVRKWMSISFGVTSAGLVGYAVWFLVQTFRFLGALTGGHGQYTLPASFDKMLSNAGSVKVILFDVFVFAIVSLYTALSADSMTKTLLMVRALREGSAPKTGE